MAIAFASNSTFTLNAGATSITIVRTPTLGNLMIVSIFCVTGTTLTISDTAVNTWTQLNAYTTEAGFGNAKTYWAKANGSSSTTITCTQNGAANFLCAEYDEFSGQDTTSPISATNIATSGGGSTANPTLNVTPADNDCMLYGSNWDATGDTAVGAGFTFGVKDATPGDWTEYKLLSGQSGIAQTVNWTAASGHWIAFAAAIKPAVSGADVITIGNQWQVVVQ